MKKSRMKWERERNKCRREPVYMSGVKWSRKATDMTRSTSHKYYTHTPSHTHTHTHTHTGGEGGELGSCIYNTSPTTTHTPSVHVESCCGVS